MSLFGIPVLEMALSIVISWALFALFCSIVHESVVQVMSERGRFLKKYLYKQLHDKPNNINWGYLLYQHPSIDLITRADNKPPSEITAQNFAQSFLETVAGSHATAAATNGLSTAERNKLLVFNSNILNNLNVAVNNMAQSDVISMLRNNFNRALISRGNLMNENLIFKNAAAAIEGGTGSPGNLQDEKQIYDNLVADLSTWYSDLTKRISVWYQKKTRLRIFILALPLATLLNIDSIELFEFYRKNPAARTEIINHYTENKTELESLAAQVGDTAWRKQALPTLKTFSHKLDSLTKANEMPIGLKYACSEYQGEQNKLKMILLKILGLLISALAASMGASYWFDLIKKIPTKTAKS